MAGVAALAAASERLMGLKLRVLLAKGAPSAEEAERRRVDHEAWLRLAERHHEEKLRR